jgi:hypothetical protein
MLATGKIVAKTAAATLELNENMVRADTTAGAMAITLPPVAEAAGKIFTVKLVTDGGDLTLQDQDDSENFSDFTLNDANERVTLYSTGTDWVTIESTIA